MLATKYRPALVFAGATVALMAKKAVAVVIGNSIANLPPWLVGAISALSFLGVAYSLWQTPEVAADSDSPGQKHSFRGVVTAFAAVYFSELGDVGQITAAAFAGRTGEPLLVWIAAVGAMVTKAVLAAYVGAVIQKRLSGRLPANAIRCAGVALAMVLGILSIMVR